MNLRITRIAVACCFAVALVTATASCSFAPRAPEALAQAQAATAPVRPAPLRIAQLSFGQKAYFAACAEPACPALTPKTLPGPAALPVTATAIDLSSHGVAAAAAVELSPWAAPRTAAAPSSALSSAPWSDPADTRILLNFPFGSAALTAESRQTLRQSLSLARQSDRIVISGRTDSVGPNEVNQQLALARALAVRNFIRDAVPDLPNVIAIDAKGRCCFLASNDDKSGRRRNRRVEVVFTSMGAM